MKNEILTERQLDILGELASAIRLHARYPNVLITAMLVGGRDGSHHSSTLASLCRKGFATRKKYSMFCGCKCGKEAMFGHRCKGFFAYGITDKGMEVIKISDHEPIVPQVEATHVE